MKKFLEFGFWGGKWNWMLSFGPVEGLADVVVFVEGGFLLGLKDYTRCEIQESFEEFHHLEIP